MNTTAYFLGYEKKDRLRCLLGHAYEKNKLALMLAILKKSTESKKNPMLITPKY